MPRKVEYDNRAVKLPHASTLGYGKWKAKAGDFIVYKEPLEDGSVNLRAARVIGRIKHTDSDGPSGIGMLLVLAITESLHYGYERWVDPANVTECMSPEHAHAFLGWLIRATPEQMFRYIRDDLHERQAASHALSGEDDEPREEEPQEDEEPQEPQEDDLVTEDHIHFYQYGKLALELHPDLSKREMWEQLDAFMDREKFYPNVWFISDHGNAHLMSRPGGFSGDVIDFPKRQPQQTPEQYEYEMREAREFQKALTVPGLDRAETKEAQELFFDMLKTQPEIVAERIGWLIDGSYGYGAHAAAKRMLASRGNKEAWLVQTVGALEWQVKPEATRRLWHKLSKAEQDRLNDVVRQEIAGKEGDDAR